MKNFKSLREAILPHYPAPGISLSWQGSGEESKRETLDKTKKLFKEIRGQDYKAGLKQLEIGEIAEYCIQHPDYSEYHQVLIKITEKTGEDIFGLIASLQESLQEDPNPEDIEESEQEEIAPPQVEQLLMTPENHDGESEYEILGMQSSPTDVDIV